MKRNFISVQAVLLNGEMADYENHMLNIDLIISFKPTTDVGLVRMTDSSKYVLDEASTRKLKAALQNES
jgi:hypothetical protein